MWQLGVLCNLPIKLVLNTLLFSLIVLTVFPLKIVEASPAVQCAEMFAKPKGFWHKTKDYGREVLSTRGRRLFLKDYDSMTGDTSKWGGLLTKQRPTFEKTGISGYLSSVLRYLPNKMGWLLTRDKQFDFTPISGLYNIAIRQPVISLSGRLTGRRFEPAFFLKLPAAITLSVGLFLGVDTVYQARLQNHINTEIATHAVQYAEAIRSDFRYNRIRTALERGEISQQEANREAYMISLAYSQYFQYRDSQPSRSTIKSEMGLIDHYLFSHLKPVIENGVSPAEGYIVPKSSIGPLSEAQVMQLFQNTHLRYLKYQIVVEMIKDSDLFGQMKSNKAFAEVVNRVEMDPFAQTLIELREQGTISSEQLQRYLQEDIYWQNRFQDWATIGVSRLKVDDQGFLGEPLQINDIRSEVLTEIYSQ